MRTERPLTNPNHPYWTAPRGVWLGVGSPASRPYPCRCDQSSRCGLKCPCRGRVDGLSAMPTYCCARRAAESRRRLGEVDE